MTHATVTVYPYLVHFGNDEYSPGPEITLDRFKANDDEHRVSEVLPIVFELVPTEAIA